MAFNLIRPMAARTGLRGARAFSTSPLALVQASKSTNNAVVAAGDTAGFKYVPGGPILPGTVNDPTSFPAPSPSHGSSHWVFERSLSAALIPIMGAAAVSSGGTYAILDGILAVSLIVHSHLGFDQILIDYVHVRKYPIIGPAAKWALRGLTGLAVWGVYEFNTNDVGLTELTRRVWKA